MAELEHTKAQFLDLAAHELRIPLTLIRGYNSMLQDGALNPARIPEIAQLLEAKLSQIDRLVDQMLETARLENGRLELHLEPVDLHEVTARQIARLKPLAPKHTLVLSSKTRPVAVRADLSRIETIVGNLIDNAIKYSPQGGQVECEVGTSSDQAFVRVRDHGVGIAPEHMPLLFKRFGRLPTTSNKKIRGTGLALYLCQELARRHGGDVTVESVPELGSEFTLRLPASNIAA
jgi:signal transduction histidine kinase